MKNALFAFDDPAAAHRAVERLAGAGLPAESVRLHVHDRGPNARITDDLDEQATGGFFHSFLGLFEGLMTWGESPHDAAAYAETIRRGGAVISIDSANDQQQAAADGVMDAAGCTQRTAWGDRPGDASASTGPSDFPSRREGLV